MGLENVPRTNKNLTNKLTHLLPVDRASEWPVSWPRTKIAIFFSYTDLKMHSYKGIICCVSNCNLSAPTRSWIPSSYRSTFDKKRPAYGLNEAPRRWWNRLDTSLRSYGMIPTRADRCCYVFHSKVQTKTGTQSTHQVQLIFLVK